MQPTKFTDNKIIDTLKRVDADLAVPEVFRELSISSTPFYKYRAKYGCMDTSMIARMKESEAKNARMKKMYIEEKHKAGILNKGISQR